MEHFSITLQYTNISYTKTMGVLSALAVLLWVFCPMGVLSVGFMSYGGFVLGFFGPYPVTEQWVEGCARYSQKIYICVILLFSQI